MNLNCSDVSCPMYPSPSLNRSAPNVVGCYSGRKADESDGFSCFTPLSFARRVVFFPLHLLAPTELGAQQATQRPSVAIQYTRRTAQVRQQQVVQAAGTDLAAEHLQQQNEGTLSPRSLYQKKKIAREQLSLQLLMHLTGEQMASIKAEFHAHDDEVDLEDFCAIMERHQPENILVKDTELEEGASRGEDGTGRAEDTEGSNERLPLSPHGRVAEEGVVPNRGKSEPQMEVSREEIVSNLVELFKEVDINGDGMMEWDEFTRFVVAKAQLHHAQMSIDQLAEYRQGPRQVEITSYNRRCEAVEQLCYIPGSHQLAVIQIPFYEPTVRLMNSSTAVLTLQEHNPIVNLYNTHSWTRVAQLRHNAVPLAMAYCGNHHTLVTASADMTLLQWYLDDVPAIKHFTLKSRWPTKHAAMSMCWSSSHRLLYSGTTIGTIQGWDIDERQDMVTMRGHSDIVMGMIVMSSLENLVSASLDTSIRLWDTYTQKPVHTLLGHNKGVHSLGYSSHYRCLVSAGFDHEAYVWSPFVNSMLNRLKGHHASLVGCQAAEGSPELITADSSGVVKAEVDAEVPGDKTSLSCFVHFKIPSVRSSQEQDDHRLVLARGKRLISFDQYRCKTEAITDEFAINCACFNQTSLTILTAAERTVKIWDAVGGILKNVFKGITGADITAVCLDDRERKFILGNARGEVAVYNFRNGAKMKDLDTQAGPVVGLIYFAPEKSVLVACQDGEMLSFDEKDPDRAAVLVNFEGGGAAYSDDLTNVALSHTNGFVATTSCSPKDGIIIWGYATGRQEYVLLHGRADGPVSSVSSLIFLDPHPFLLAAYSDGSIGVWGMKGSSLKGLLVLTFRNQAPAGASFWDEEDAEYPLMRLRPAEYPTGPEPGEERAEKGDMSGRDGRSKKDDLGDVASGNTLPPQVGEGQGDCRVGSWEQGTGKFKERTEGKEAGDGKDYSEWKAHPRLTPRKDLALQVVSTAWDASTSKLFTGDETGRLRCWSFERLLRSLGTQSMQEERNGSEDDEMGDGDACSGIPKSQILGLPPELCVRGPDFLWGAESAHEDSIGLVVLIPTDPPALLTTSADRCVKTWTLDGRPQGLLLQGLSPHAPNPRWSFSVNVEALAVAEAAETESVLARIDQRSRDTESEQDETSTVLSVGSQGSRSNRCHPSKHHRQGQQYGAHRNHHSRRRHLVANRSDSIGAVSCDSWSGASDANNHVVGAVSQAEGEATEDQVGNGSTAGSGHRSGRPAGYKTPMSRVSMNRIESIGASDASSDWTSDSASSRSVVGRLRGWPSVVPPSPGRRRGEPEKGLSKIVDKLGKLLDEAERFSEAHTNRFAGRRSDLSDFIKGDGAATSCTSSTVVFTSSGSVSSGDVDED